MSRTEPPPGQGHRRARAHRGSGLAPWVAVFLIALTNGAGCSSLAGRPKAARTTDGRLLEETAAVRKKSAPARGAPTADELPPLPGEVAAPAPGRRAAVSGPPGGSEVDLRPVDREPVLRTGADDAAPPVTPPPIPLEITGAAPSESAPALPALPDAPRPAAAPALPVSQIPPGPVGAGVIAPGAFPAGLPPTFAPMAPAECATCGNQGKMAGPDAVPPFTCPHGGCGAGGCVPGGKPCYQCQAHTFVGRFIANLYECLCCPDPCYQPRWIPEANAAFFTDWARPRTITRFRYDHAPDLLFPDRSEFFWARDDGKGSGPRPPHPFPKPGSVHPYHPNLKPVQYKGERSVRYDQLYLYQEAATARASFFIEYYYRSNFPLLTPHTAGFGDLNLGTKSLLLDCELTQLTFQFKTFIPTGAAINGLGTGHVSLEPSLLTSVRLATETYFQGQLSEWIPLGGNPGFAGSIIHYHGSLNHCLYRFTPDVPVIGTLEAVGYTFQSGAYTDPVLGIQKSSGFTYFSVGPGLRVSVCNNLDFGVGVSFPTTDPHWGNPLIRTELRILY